jgi:hypothetical protein
MIARPLLRLPWFFLAPSLMAMAAVLALGLHLMASAYFERSFRDDADPLAGLVPAAPTATHPLAVGGSVAPDPAGTAALAIPAAGVVASAATPTPAPVASPTPALTAGVLAQGVFRDGDPGHHGEGRARLIRGPDGALTLRFEEFSVTNGPDLYVVLTTDPNGGRDAARAADALTLGRLRATDGNINYPIPEGTDVSRFRSVVIYCRAFHVVFALAPLA